MATGKMHIRFHTVAAIVVLLASGAWVATGKYAFVGSEIADDGQETPAELPTPGPTAGAVTTAEPTVTLQTVAFVTAEPAAYERRIRLSGQTEADKQVILVARTSGGIGKLPVSEGDSVAEGGLVMALDGPEKLAAVVSAQVQFDTAVHQAETDQQLRARGSLPELQLQTSIAAREAARSALETAKAEVDRLEVHAPFAGIIDKVFVEAGSWVQPGTEVASLLALDPIIVVAEINERDLQSVSKGTRATVTFGDGTTAKGEVRYVRREASGLTRTFPIEVAIGNPNAAIPAGMSAEIDLAAKTAPAVVLPRSVVTLDANGTLGVRVLTVAGTVAFLKVTIVDDTPDGLVLSDVPVGTRIIVSGQNMVSEGQQVAAVEATGGKANSQGSD
ncbi:MAG: efflux RND transporter periplasmic adaptor subunit [Cypionkella sp.]